MAIVARALAEALKDHYALERELGRGGMATVYLEAWFSRGGLDRGKPSGYRHGAASGMVTTCNPAIYSPSLQIRIVNR